MRHRALFLLLLAFLLTACDPLGLDTITPTPEPTAIPTTAPVTDTPQPEDTPEASNTPTEPVALVTVVPSVTGGLPNSQAMSELSEIESDTVEVRGLEPKSDVKEQFITNAQMSANLTQEIKDEYSREEARRDATTLWLLRLVDDPSIDLYQLQIDLLGEQVLGYYDNEKKELFVRSDQTELSPLTRGTLAHEYVHSLQDQYFDLSKIRPDEIENDSGTAVLALVEGDAVISQIAYAQKYMSAEDLQKLLTESNSIAQPVLDSAPRYIRNSLIFPYEQGPTFIEALARAQPGSFKGVNDALADPPQSTEQILHPEKYLEKPRDEPIAVSLPPLTTTLGAGWTFADTDTMGEFDLRELLQINSVDDPDAWEGWGGGRYDLYQKGDTSLLLLQTRWDTARDAAEFNTAMQQSLESLTKTNGLWSDGKRTFGLKRTGDTITFVGSTDSAAAQRALDEVK